MIDRRSLAKAWALLDRKERRNAFKVLAVMVISAFASAAMVGSIFPFLSVLSDPSLIHDLPALAWAFRVGGFANDYSFLVALGLGAIGVIVAANVVLAVKVWVLSRFTQMRVYSLSRRLIGHYLAQPYEFFLNRHSGDMSTAILAEARQVVGLFLSPLANLISSGLSIIAVIAMLVMIEPIVATVTIATFVMIYGAVMVVTRRHVKRMGELRVLANRARFRIAGEALGGVKDVKLLGREAQYVDRFSVPAMETARIGIAMSLITSIPQRVIQMLAFGGIIVLCLVLLDPESLHEREALGGILPLLGLMAFAAQRILPELQGLYGAITSMASGTAALERVYEDLFSGSQARLDRSRPSPLGLSQALSLEGVTYTYPNADRPGLRDVSLTIQAGERIGVVGASGAGKTTLADIVLGLLTPQAGTLRADGTEITSQTMRAWQQTVGYVPQDIFLTDASLSENIALGLRTDEIDAEKVERAARIAQLHDFAMTELLEGYATLIGERGVRLSGGQRQRIGIARALYHDADLIVFDEATSALDNLTEREVMAAIEALPGDTTILMIAHRLSTVKVCDRILVMDRGSVAGIGSWDELCEANATFRALAHAA